MIFTKLISGLIPTDTCKGYGVKTASYTEGKGMFTTKFHGYKDTDFAQAKVNEDEINPATNRGLYLLHKLGGIG